MANYLANLGDTQVLLEAPAAGGLAKGSLEVQPDPTKAIENMVDLIKRFAQHSGQAIVPTLRHVGGALEVRFAVRANAAGLVMISESAEIGQFQCTLKFLPPRPAPR